MKKVLILGLLFLVLLAGCSAKDDVYIIATDTAFPPFEYTNDKNEFVGIDVDLITTIAERQGIKIELQALGFSAALAALESGQAHGLIAGMSVTEARKEKYDFSDTYFEVYAVVGVKAGSDIKSLEDLRGKNVALKEGTTSADYAESIKDEYGFTTSYFDSSPVMYQDVELGNSAACFEDEPILEFNIKQGINLEIMDGVRVFPTLNAFAVMKGENQELLEKFNAGLKELIEDGTYDDIVAKHTK